MIHGFDQCRAWIFDVDYTLYGPEAALFEQVVPRITQFVSQTLDLPMAEARDLQRQYFQAYGSTLGGMVRHHAIDPHAFTDFVHGIDYSVLRPNPHLRQQIATLPGRKFLFTNATRKHAKSVLTGLGLDLSDFDGAFDVEMANWTPKPHRLPYDLISDQFDIAPEEAVFFEDTSVNLATARDLGWKTVWIKSGDDPRQDGTEFAADLRSSHITQALAHILGSFPGPQPSA